MPVSNIIYEQPLNEHIRFCLRLEHLFLKVKNYLASNASASSRAALETILEILTAVDRPDLKTKLSKALSSYSTSLTQLLNRKLPKDIDEKKLKRILDQLNKLIVNIHINPGKIGQNLRKNEFLASIQQRLTTPGGTCPFNIPAYHLWLNLSPKLRLENLGNWFNEFAEVKNAVMLLLKLTRESAEFESIKAKDGFCQISLDTNISHQMVRIILPTQKQIYPKTSVGRHRLLIHFYELSPEGKDSQILDNVEFKLACCKI